MTYLELLIVLFSVGFLFLFVLPSNVTLSLATGISLLGLLIGLFAANAFDKSLPGFQFLSSYEVLPTYNLSLTFGVDGLSTVFLLLTLFVFPVCLLATQAGATKQFILYVYSMELLLVLTFSTLDLFFFFVFFESLLIPMFLLIGIWGARERKIKAAYYFFLYTLFGSLFMLFGVLYLYTIAGTTDYATLLSTTLNGEQQSFIWFCFFLAFAVKMPLFPLHIWLPEAHVEAPTVGSMLLASLLLKLGGYGFIRFSLALLPVASSAYSPVVSMCALLGVLYASLSTLRQIDMKRVIAYSSVAHMNLVVLGLFSNSQQGVEGATYLMLGHGVVSTALFFCVGVLYDRHHSRLLRYYGGLVTPMPLFVTAFFLFTLANMSFPGTPNFLGELLIFLGVFEQNALVLLFSTAGIVLAAVYSVWLFNRISFGTLKEQYITHFYDLTRREAAVFLTLLPPMVLFGLSANYLLEFIHLPVEYILAATPVFTKTRLEAGLTFCMTGIVCLFDFSIFTQLAMVALSFHFVTQNRGLKFFFFVLFVVGRVASFFEEQVIAFLLYLLDLFCPTDSLVHLPIVPLFFAAAVLLTVVVDDSSSEKEERMVDDSSPETPKPEEEERLTRAEWEQREKDDSKKIITMTAAEWQKQQLYAIWGGFTDPHSAAVESARQIGYAYTAYEIAVRFSKWYFGWLCKNILTRLFITP